MEDKKIQHKLNNKAQLSVSTFFQMMVLILIMGVWLQIIYPILDEVLYPILESFEYGSVIRLMFQLIPLLMGVLVLIQPWRESQTQAYGRV